jgi:hypothetical protein
MTGSTLTRVSSGSSSRNVSPLPPEPSRVST